MASTFWIGGLVGTLFGAIAIILLMRSISKTQGLINKSLRYLLGASGAYIFYMTLVVFFGIKNISLDSILWYSVLLLYFIAGGIWAYFAYSMTKLNKRIDYGEENE